MLRLSRLYSKDGILKEQGVRRHVRKNDRISYDVYSLELVIAVAFRIDSIESRAFREFIMQSVIGKTDKPHQTGLYLYRECNGIDLP